MAIGGATFEGTSKLFDGPLGVVRIGFDGYDLGKTVGDTTLTPDQDIKDIAYQQEGTKAADHVRTGQEYLLTTTLGEINTGVLVLLMAGISAGADAADDDVLLDRSLFQSMLDNEAAVLKVAACDANGLASADSEDILCCYHAIPIITGELVNWGVDTQRNLPVQFRIKYHTFTAGELAALTRTDGGAFGYIGDADDAAVDCTAVVWTDRTAPAIVTAEATAATTMVVTFDENLEFQTAEVLGHYTAWVNGIASLCTVAADPTGTAIMTLTFAALTFAALDVITISISAEAIEDAGGNAYGGCTQYPVTNSV